MNAHKPFEGRIAVVTGASRGIGYQIAKSLGTKGAHVVAIARTVGALEELDDEIQAAGGSTTLVPVDLKDFDAIDRLGAAIYERWKKLDFLIGNAGILGVLSPVGHISPKVFEETLAVNVTANWRLIRSLDPLLRQSDTARAVFLTAAEAHSCKPYWSLQATTKAALEALVKTYAAETRNMGVRANLFDPGPVRTALRAKAMPGEDPARLPAPEEVVPAVLDLLSPDLTATGETYSYSSRKAA
ncbi:SDR family NAD(P)-dependent oxidoreductase [Stappia sp. F7233]|uniref:SDR family NAD(P)-dependent oxidoreductase n=1 Tax=Stappia albiluteola TaxID=2758565 RepID=A0A839ADZ4_9HYPH|nr:SDR family NAD(P)-dependent oxidoreductase [Stappia albiluteola]MBA5776829.1 SDR family NAD(P)-dependent oxidoreductase [Stappia albiluteola]